MDKNRALTVSIIPLVASLGLIAYFEFRSQPKWSVTNIDFAESGVYFAIGFNLTNQSPYSLTAVSASVSGAYIGTCNVSIAPNATSYCNISGKVDSCSAVGPLPVGKLSLTARFAGSGSSEQDFSVAPRGGGCA